MKCTFSVRYGYRLTHPTKVQLITVRSIADSAIYPHEHRSGDNNNLKTQSQDSISSFLFCSLLHAFYPMLFVFCYSNLPMQAGFVPSDRQSYFRGWRSASNFSTLASSTLEMICFSSCMSRVVFDKLIVDPTVNNSPMPIYPFTQEPTGR